MARPSSDEENQLFGYGAYRDGIRELALSEEGWGSWRGWLMAGGGIADFVSSLVGFKGAVRGGGLRRPGRGGAGGGGGMGLAGDAAKAATKAALKQGKQARMPAGHLMQKLLRELAFFGKVRMAFDQAQALLENGQADALLQPKPGEEDASRRACFAAGTPVLTPCGWRPIESLRAGDVVLARAEHDPDGPVEAKVLLDDFMSSGPVLSLWAGGREVRTTAEHPFWVRGQGWTAAGMLREGDVLVSHDGQAVAVQSVRDAGEVVALYNVRVADHSTYFVGCQEWGFSLWAHNECFYRAMSAKELAKVLAAQRLDRREEGSSNLGVTQSRAYAESLIERRDGERKYPHVVEIEVKDGTSALLVSIGGKHNSIPDVMFPGRPAWDDTMPVQLKFERGGVVSYLLTTDAGVQVFNGQIVAIRQLR